MDFLSLCHAELLLYLVASQLSLFYLFLLKQREDIFLLPIKILKRKNKKAFKKQTKFNFLFESQPLTLGMHF